MFYNLKTMYENQIQIEKKIALLRFKEDYIYNQKLNALTIFPFQNIYSFPKIKKVILNFSFKSIDFNKKKALAFFLAMELLTNQKCIATLSSKNILVWKLRKGMLVGCKITLRKTNLYEFLDTLNLTLPRMEKFTTIKVKSINKIRTDSLILLLQEIILFYPIELGLGINTEVKKIEVNFIFNTRAKEEKIFCLRSNKIPTE